MGWNMNFVLDSSEKIEILETYNWIKVSSYRDDSNKSWEERYRELERHHLEETRFLIEKLRKIVSRLD